MFANRYTAIIDACSLARVLQRNLLLTLAEAEFFRVRWSSTILDETEQAIAKILHKKGVPDHLQVSATQRERMEQAFADAMVEDFEMFSDVGALLPDKDDGHVLAAAIKTKADAIVTENLKDFPEEIIKPLNIEVRTSDAFIADAIALHEGKAVAAVRTMRLRFRNPAKTPEKLLSDMEAFGLIETADVLAPHVGSM